jgi:hypothetical protein
VRAAGSAARLSFGANGLPSLLQQDGWSVEYRDWYADRSPPLPRKVFAERAPYRVRVSIESWTLRGKALVDRSPRSVDSTKGKLCRGMPTNRVGECQQRGAGS